MGQCNREYFNLRNLIEAAGLYCYIFYYTIQGRERKREGEKVRKIDRQKDRLMNR